MNVVTCKEYRYEGFREDILVRYVFVFLACWDLFTRNFRDNGRQQEEFSVLNNELTA